MRRAVGEKQFQYGPVVLDAWRVAVCLTAMTTIVAHRSLKAENTAGYLPVEVHANGGRIRVEYNGRALLAPVEGRHAVALFSNPPTTDGTVEDQLECKVDYHIESVAGGFDILVTLSNPAIEPKRRPDITISGFRMNSDVETQRDRDGRVTAYVDRGLHWLDGRDLGQVRGSMRHWAPQRWHYPGDLYSPVLAAWDDEIAVGVSLIFDPWAARHDVFAEYKIVDGRLFMGFRLHAPCGSNFVSERSLLAPGETDDYRVAVRFSEPRPERKPHPGWVDALRPYRDSFVSRFGKVRYRRDLRPVFGQPMAQTEYARQHPRGYSPAYRVDEEGWKSYIDQALKPAVEKGYRRVMVWVPSGIYQVGMNYPTEFMTEWPRKLLKTLPELLAFKKSHGVTLGMWWGRSSQVSGGWNTGRMWVRDVTKPADVQAAWDELDLASKRGMDEVGLDAYGYPPLYHRHAFMKKMQKRYPKIRFITEAADCDIMHTLAPTFMTFRRQRQRPVLADWLVPGHESWIMLNYQEVTLENFETIVGWNCVPVTITRGLEHRASDYPQP